MSDPRFTDPRLDPRLDDPVARSDARTGGMWGWVAGVVVLALIAFVLISGWQGNSQQASNSQMTPSAPIGSSSAPPARPAPSTTGSGMTSPQPNTPAPAAPATPPAPSR